MLYLIGKGQQKKQLVSCTLCKWACNCWEVADNVRGCFFFCFFLKKNGGKSISQVRISDRVVKITWALIDGDLDWPFGFWKVGGRWQEIATDWWSTAMGNWLPVPRVTGYSSAMNYSCIFIIINSLLYLTPNLWILKLIVRFNSMLGWNLLLEMFKSIKSSFITLKTEWMNF